jgi:hypothetical protein
VWEASLADNSEIYPDLADSAMTQQISSTGHGEPMNKTTYTKRELATANNRRESERFRTRVPITVFAGESEISAYTRDLSNRGIFFYLDLLDSALIENNIEFLVEFPAEFTLSTSCRIRCCGRLVRKERTSRNFAEIGMAAEVLKYSVVGEVIS